MDAVWIKIAAMTVCVAVATIDQPHPIQLTVYTGGGGGGSPVYHTTHSDQGIRHTVSIAQSVTGLMGSPARALSLAVAANRFINRAAIVTGGASGIGKATVERLSEEGASVAVFDINKEAGESLADQLKAAGGKVVFSRVDVSDKQECLEAVSAFAKQQGGHVNYLVNNAVYFGSKGLTAEKKDWDKSFSVNVQGYANMVQSCHEYMRCVPGRDGKAVVNIASISGHIAQPTRWTYSATKGAILTMTRCMGLDLSPDNIRVNSVSPAWVWTPEVSKAAEGNREKWEPVWGPHHMPRRLSETSEIAAAIAFLLSDDASFITATDLPTDGGYMAMGPEGLGENSKFAGTDY